jgi:Fic family protein
LAKSGQTKRQIFILQTIDTLGKASNLEILSRISGDFDKASRVTVIRDLNALLQMKLIKKTGEGRGVIYISNTSLLERSFDAESYFSKEPDKREIKKERLDFKDSYLWEKLFSAKDIENVNSLTKQYQSHFSKYNQAQIRRELERITIEFSWKSSHIEGNTYTLLDTERLIKEHKEAKGKTHEEAAMILTAKRKSR